MNKTTQLAIANTETSVTVEALRDVKALIAKDASDAELKLFAMHCNRTGLDPFSNQIFLIVRGFGERRKATFQTSIDGYRIVAERSGKYAGNDDPVFDPEFDTGKSNYPRWAKVTVHKMVEGQRVPFSATARWDEYKQEFKGQLGNMWAKMPATMLGKCAEALALRKAFPNDLAGIYTNEEMSQADNGNHQPAAPAAKPEPRVIPANVEPTTGEIIEAKTEPEKLAEVETAPQNWIDGMYKRGTENGYDRRQVQAMIRSTTGKKSTEPLTKAEVTSVVEAMKANPHKAESDDPAKDEAAFLAAQTGKNSDFLDDMEVAK